MRLFTVGYDAGELDLDDGRLLYMIWPGLSFLILDEHDALKWMW